MQQSNESVCEVLEHMMSVPVARAQKVLKAAWLDSPLGPMIAVADDQELYLLEFSERRGLISDFARLCTRLQAAILPGETKPIRSIKNELMHYFRGDLQQFQTPIRLVGSPFQQQVWEELQRIPYGETRSYRDVAVALGRPTGFRAVARANGTNRLAIIVPCHRVINSDGQLGGYGGGLWRKERMLQLEGAWS